MATNALLPTLTIRQPWAALIASKAKRLETRSWAPPARLIGTRLAIHAGRSAIPRDLASDDVSAIEVALGRPVIEWSSLPFGAIVCVATLVGAYEVAEWHPGADIVGVRRTVAGSPPLAEITLRPGEWRYGDYRPGRWLWMLGDVEVLDVPVPATGQQGVWRWAGSFSAVRRATQSRCTSK